MIKILHVEDDPDIREIANLALMMSGEFEVLQCESGEAALDVTDHFTPDVLLLDMMMPNMTGKELMLQLRKLESYKSIPAIFMTARAQPTEVKELRDLGAIDVIVKPFDPMTLSDQIKAAISRN